MGNIPHYFIAIPVTDELQEEFANWQIDLKENLSYKNWPHRRDLHITLKFLGAVEKDKLHKLQESLRSVIYSSFSVSVGSIGTFGKQDSPRVLWAGVEKSTEISELYNKVEQAAIKVGFVKENRPYAPHITLAKKWNGSFEHSDRLIYLKDSYHMRTFQMDIEEFVLYQIYPSRLPKYKRVETFSLRG